MRLTPSSHNSNPHKFPQKVLGGILLTSCSTQTVDAAHAPTFVCTHALASHDVLPDASKLKHQLSLTGYGPECMGLVIYCCLLTAMLPQTLLSQILPSIPEPSRGTVFFWQFADGSILHAPGHSSSFFAAARLRITSNPPVRSPS